MIIYKGTRNNAKWLINKIFINLWILDKYPTIHPLYRFNFSIIILFNKNLFILLNKVY